MGYYGRVNKISLLCSLLGIITVGQGVMMRGEVENFYISGFICTTR